MRPTIPLADWRIATDLTAARALAAAAPPPPCSRSCAWCRNWSLAHAATLPSSVATELRRLGVDPAAPTDLYAFAEPAAGDPAYVPHRVMFRTVGEILSGPVLWTEDARFGRVRHYVPVSGLRGHSGLSVAYERDVGGEPEWNTAAHGPLVQIDFRLQVPWLLGEPRPAVFAAASQPRTG